MPADGTDQPAPQPDAVALQARIDDLQKENRKLERKLARSEQLTVKTDEVYRSSERVLNQAYAEMEELVAKIKEQSETLNRSSRLAALGEMAGRVAHEVLNPLTGLLGRIAKLKKMLRADPEASPLSVATEIAEDWRQRATDQTFATYVHERDPDGAAPLEQDVDDLLVLLGDVGKERSEIDTDMDFLEKTLLRITRIIDGMRGLSRSSSSTSRVNMNEVVEETLELLGGALEKCRIAVSRHYDKALPFVMADRDELIQVVTNVVRNASQAIGADGTITIATTHTPERVELRITDTGGGLSSTITNPDLIFESGFTTKSASEGTGLGLGICRRFTRKLGGDIKVDWTAPGQGTTILVYLPLGEPAAATPTAPAVADTSTLVTAPPFATPPFATPPAAAPPVATPPAAAPPFATPPVATPPVATLVPAAPPPDPGATVLAGDDPPTFVPAKSRFALRDDD